MKYAPYPVAAAASGDTPSVLVAVLLRAALGRGAGTSPDPLGDLVDALLAGGAQPDERGDLQALDPNLPPTPVNAVEIAALYELRDAEKKLRAAGGIVDAARLSQARRALAAAGNP